MFYVLIPTCSVHGILNPGAEPTLEQRQRLTFTRKGRRYTNQKAAEALASKHLGKVVDVNSGRIVRNFL